MRVLPVMFLALSLGGLACNHTNADPPSGANADAANGSSAAGTSGETGIGTRPVWREVAIPAGTRMAVVLDTGVGSDTSRLEEPVEAHTSRAIIVDGAPVLAEGTRVRGIVTEATPSAKIKGRASVSVRFDSLAPSGGDRYTIETEAIHRTAAATKGRDAEKIGGGAAGGAVIGALFGGKKGALIGTAVGGGAGTALVLSTSGKEIRLAQGAPLTVRLTAPVTIKVRG
jgi:hypothetical protein